jgi:hypothetical protein
MVLIAHIRSLSMADRARDCARIATFYTQLVSGDSLDSPAPAAIKFS